MVRNKDEGLLLQRNFVNKWDKTGFILLTKKANTIKKNALFPNSMRDKFGKQHGNDYR